MATKTGKNKEVAKHPRMGSREESFGGAPGSIPVEGGTMHMFGHKVGGQSVWPTNVVGPDVKTGYPQGFDKGKKGPKA
jgi:septal ring factor EnvC (AmiA/AmiB activator)